ncbi:TetR/AcrR family transcriptional regulator [Aliikangiella sp. IMCC44359]|uniref:TetR/AcrR family transcriptional regulator n=1 Tax=Aliikangiella sp. IMCC44359 TaxID=3459125 RepID=UPI00403A9CCE
MDTADEIMTLAQNFIQTGGYNAFSYKDIADKLGIKTSSIHYHFPKKADLGCAVIERYIKDFKQLKLIINDETQDPKERFERYLKPFIETDHTGTKICLCGALGGELFSLPESMRKSMNDFFCFHEEWLSQILLEIRAEKNINTTEPSLVSAQYIFSTLQGALLIARSKNNNDFFRQIIKLIRLEALGHSNHL